MGLKSSKKTDAKADKLQTLEAGKRELASVVVKISRRRDKEFRQKSTNTTHLCEQLRNALIKDETLGNVTDSVSKVTKNDQSIKQESVKRELSSIEFKVERINRFDSYAYGSPSTAAISYLEAMQLETEESLTFHLQEYEKEVRIDRRLLTLNSDFLHYNLAPDIFMITIRGYHYESIQTVAISLYTKTMYISLNTFYDIFRFCYELKINVILELLTSLCNTFDPIYLLAELRKLIINDELGIQYTRLMYDICHNYNCILKHSAIVDLTFDEMRELVKPRDEVHKYLSLDPRCELLVYNAVINWISHEQTRLRYCLDLLRYVRFEKLRPEEWKKTFNPNLLQSFPEKLRKLMFKINDTFGAQRGVFEVYSKLDKIENFSENREVPEYTFALPLRSKRNEMKRKESKEFSELKKTKCDQIEESENMVKEALRSFKTIIGTQMLGDLPAESKHSLSQHSILLLFGGFQSQVPYKSEQGLFMHQLKPADPADCISATTNFTWCPLSQRLPKTLAHFQALKIGTIIFIIGGIDVSCLLHEKSLAPVNECCAYSLTNDDWYKVAAMNYPRGYHSCVSVKDKIYVFGGISVNQYRNLSQNKIFLTNAFEVFDIRNNVWSEICSEQEKPCPRMAFGMVYHQDVIWIIGGLTGSVDKNNYESGELLSDVWIYSLKYKKWKSVEFWRLPKPRAFMTSIMFRNQIFVIGGHEVEEKTENEQRTMRDSRTNSVIIFRDVNNAWEEGPALNLPRIYPAATVFNNVLFVIGGVTHDHKHIDEPVLRSFSGSYEIYNPDINPNWVDNSMVFSVHGACAVTV